MRLHVPIGIDDFRMLRERRLEYIDKSHLISELIDNPGLLVLLFPRPRRFGKTLNLTMLRYFFEKRGENLWPLFEGLHIARAGEAYTQHFGRYPLIYLTLKDAKFPHYEQTWGYIKNLLQEMYNEHRWLLEHPSLDPLEKSRFEQILDGSAPQQSYADALRLLTAYLHKATGERAVVLIDEYDAPVHVAYINGYSREILDFLRIFLGAGLEGNTHIFLAVITGILRVAKESIFSGLNNLGVYSVLSPRFRTCFGFSEEEVRALLEKSGDLARLDSVRAYYNGYSFGGQAMYNPWSILNFVHSEQRQIAPYWLGTSSNDLAREVLQTHAFAVKDDIETLLLGGTLEKQIDENVPLDDLKTNPNSVWSLLVFTGYLKAWYEHHETGDWNPPAKLAIPNGEIFCIYRSTFKNWLDQSFKVQGGSLDTFLNALLCGKAELVQEQLQYYASHLVSFHDAAHAKNIPERFYHGLLLGLLAALEPDYKVRSNRESGKGRPDILILPTKNTQAGAVLEIKMAPPPKSKSKNLGKKPAAVEKLLNEALKQMDQQAYTAELKGAMAIYRYAVVFDGKQVWVKAQDS